MRRVLGGLYVKIPPSEDAQALSDEFQSANRLVWDRKGSFAENRQAREKWGAAWERILASESFSDITHFVFKRSFPFSNPREQFVPYLWDVEELTGKPLFVVMFRDPRASAFSTLRRGFDQDLRRLAVLCSEQSTLLSAQAQTIPADQLKVVSYSRLCLRPVETIAPLLTSFELAGDAVHQAIVDELPTPLVDDRFKCVLSEDQVTWLSEFFDDRRCRQWGFLKIASESGS